MQEEEEEEKEGKGYGTAWSHYCYCFGYAQTPLALFQNAALCLRAMFFWVSDDGESWFSLSSDDFIIYISMLFSSSSDDFIIYIINALFSCILHGYRIAIAMLISSLTGM
jgi:hypothetical protein